MIRIMCSLPLPDVVTYLRKAKREGWLKECQNEILLGYVLNKHSHWESVCDAALMAGLVKKKHHSKC